MEDLKKQIKSAAKSLFGEDIEPELTRPDEQFGDYATNVALQLAKKLGKKPREVADALVKEIESPDIEKTEVAGPGFINITLTDSALITLAHKKSTQKNAGEEILVEFGDPNPFKEMHIGHVYSYIVGDSISTLFEYAGSKVKRLSYHGDVGLHVAKAIYAVQKDKVDLTLKTALGVNIGHYYAKGAKAYEEDPSARKQIDLINEHIYKKDNESINKLYEWGRDRSLANFEETLKDLEISMPKQYFESESSEVGLKTVKANIGEVFKESDGAIVFDGEKVGLHTRVFITSKGLPTYETKDLGLAEIKNKDYPEAKLSVIITAHEQAEYFKVMLAALAEFDEPLAKKTLHMSHGFVSLSTGKMSSRKGNVYKSTSAIVDIEKQIKKAFPDANRSTRNAAIKYDFLKHRLGSDIVYDIEKSFSLEGNSGPYLQYAHARACSILNKKSPKDEKPDKFEKGERSLLRKISEFPEVVDKSVEELMPHHICTYLYELAQNFNRFYEKNRVIGDKRENVRLQLVQLYADTIKEGLNLLNIEAPEKM